MEQKTLEQQAGDVVQSHILQRGGFMISTLHSILVEAIVMQDALPNAFRVQLREEAQKLVALLKVEEVTH